MFDVVASNISSYANGLTFADAAVGPPPVVATTPSLAAVTAYIGEAGKVGRGAGVGMGVGSDAIRRGAAPDTYALCAMLVKLDTAAWAVASRSRDNVELAREYRRRYESKMEELKAAKQYLGTGRNVASTAPGLARGPATPGATVTPDCAISAESSNSFAASNLASVRPVPPSAIFCPDGSTCVPVPVRAVPRIAA